MNTRKHKEIELRENTRFFLMGEILKEKAERALASASQLPQKAEAPVRKRIGLRRIESRV